nr:unnamed protein product [Callosobruchus chinensis]
MVIELTCFNIILAALLYIFIRACYCAIYSCRILCDMEPEVAKFMRTERKPGSIDVHPNIDAIVLSYEIDNLKKNIELPMINSRTDCHALAKEVVNQCDLIHHSRLAEVEQIIYYIKKRKLQSGSKGGTALGDGDKNTDKIQNGNQEANYNNLSDYIDLYMKAWQKKLKEHISYKTLISALGRVLREDWKRSITLSAHLVFIFFCFSMYSCFHEVILKCKIGSICMDILDYELRRYDKWKADLEGGEAPSDIPIIRKPCPNSASMSDIPRSRIPEPVRPKSGNFSDTNIKAVMEGSVYDDLTTSMENIDDKKLTPEQKLKRFRSLLRKQEHLIRVAFYLLLNISEDESVEEKMVKRNIAGLLIKALERDNDDLLILVVTFLKKLSIMQCNKDTMISLNRRLVHLTLKLLFNLSFDNKVRYKLIKVGLLPKIVSYLSDDKHREVVLKILYHLSYEDEVKHYFVDSIGLIIDMLLLNAGNEDDKTMVALCINLSTDPSNTHQIIKSNRLQSLMMRAFTYEDAMLMKMLRNISDSAISAPSFIEFVGDIAKAVVESKQEDFVRECIGILSNLHLPDLDWAEIFKHFDMIKWVKNVITSNNTDPELVLQVVVLLGTAATDGGCAKLLCEKNILAALIDLLKTHQEDDEIVLQIVKICNTCLNIISEHSKIWADRICIEKFRNHNAHWLQMVDSQQFAMEEEEEEDELPPYLNTEYLSTAVVSPLRDLNEAPESQIIQDDELDYNYFNGHDNDMMQDLEIEAI